MSVRRHAQLLLALCLCIPTGLAFADAKEIFHSNQDRILLIKTHYRGRPLGHGSSFVVSFDKKNYLVTNFHVISAGTFYLEQGDKKFENASILYANDVDDIAILTFPGIEKMTAISVDPAEPTEGDKVYAVGYPGIAGTDARLTITDGLVSNSRLALKRGSLADQRFIQISAAINPGNSGGPVFSESGQLIGMATLKWLNLSNVAAALPAEALVSEIKKLASGTRTKETESAVIRARCDLIAAAVKENRPIDVGLYYAPSTKLSKYQDVIKITERIRNAATIGLVRFKGNQDNFFRYMAGELTPDEWIYFTVLNLFFQANPQQNVTLVSQNPFLASRLFLSARFYNLFQKMAGVPMNQLNYESYTIDKLALSDDLQQADVDVQVTIKAKTFPVHFKFAHEWGNWFLLPSYPDKVQ